MGDKRTPPEGLSEVESYLIQYQNLAERKEQIVAMIDALEQVTAAFFDWRKEAVSTASKPRGVTQKDEQVFVKFAVLLPNVIEFRNRMARIMRLWDKISPQKQRGLLSPDSI